MDLAGGQCAGDWCQLFVAALQEAQEEAALWQLVNAGGGDRCKEGGGVKIPAQEILPSGILFDEVRESNPEVWIRAKLWAGFIRNSFHWFNLNQHPSIPGLKAI